MKRRLSAALALLGVAGCFPPPVTGSPAAVASTVGAPVVGPPPGSVGASVRPVATPPPGSDTVTLPVAPTQTFHFDQPLDGAVLTRDTPVTLRGLPGGATFTLTVDAGVGPQPATLVPLGPAQATWQLGGLPDGAYQLVADVGLPNGARGIARTHVRLFRRIGAVGGGGGGGGSSGPPAPVLQPPLQPDAWADLAAMPQARAEVGGGAVGQQFVLFGGFGNGANVTSDAFVFDAVANTWQTAGNAMPTARTALCSAVAAGRVYALGGLDTIFDPLKVVESYDPVGDSWLQGADLPAERFYATAAVLHDEVYVFGGLDGGWAEMATADRYDPVADAWTAVAAMPTARYSACAAALNDEIVVMGGAQGNAALRVVEAYKPATNAWRRLADLPANVAAGMAVSHGGRLYVFGGYDTAPAVTVWRYEPGPNTWVLHSVLQRDHIGGVAAAIGTKVYIAGGYNGIDAHNRFQVMTPLP
jgi:N-acetylneuraminic acid mutarotase